MRTIFQEECKCDLCKRTVPRVIDTTMHGGGWAYQCDDCLDERRIKVGTIIESTTSPPWYRRFPNLAKAIAETEGDEFYESYVHGMGKTDVRFGDDGIRSQVPYLINNAKDGSKLRCFTHSLS